MDPILLVLVTLIVVVAGAYFYTSQKQKQTAGTNEPKIDASLLRGEGPSEPMDMEDDDDDDDDDSEESDDEGKRRRPKRQGRRRADAPATGASGVKHNKRKAEKAAEREERRMANQQMIEDRRKKKENALEKEEREKREEEERKAAEEATLAELRAEAKKKKDEEYQQWVGAIAVEEKGDMGTEEEAQQNLLRKLAETIKEEKMVVLHDLARDLAVSVERIVSGIEHLIAENELSGVFDDRGKFIYITTEEFDNISKFIRQRGRVSMPELVRECNRVVSTGPAKVEAK